MGKMFKDRTQAGNLLVERLKNYVDTDTVVVGIPKGGVVVGYAIAKALYLPLEITLSLEIGHQLNKAFAIGYVGLNSRAISWASNISMEYLEKETQRIQAGLLEKYRSLTGRQDPYSLTGKTVIISDDMILSGNTLLRSIRLIQKSNPLRIIAAAPVVRRDCIDKISKQVEEFIYLNSVAPVKNEFELCPEFRDIDETEIKNMLKITTP